MKQGPYRVPLAERIARRVKINDKTGCHEFQGSLNNGYGKVGFRLAEGGYKSVPAHRLAYELAHGEVPKELQVCHTCDNRCCVNLEHLFLGTAKDNADDREAKGRGNQPHGSRSPTAKLSETKVVEIRNLKGAGFKNEELAARFGVNKSTIKRVMSGEHWSHVKWELA